MGTDGSVGENPEVSSGEPVVQRMRDGQMTEDQFQAMKSRFNDRVDLRRKLGKSELVTWDMVNEMQSDLLTFFQSYGVGL